MCQFIETIKIKNNSLCALSYHNQRVNFSRNYWFHLSDIWKLENLIALTDLNSQQIYKCRIIYGSKIESCDITPYIFPKINTLRIIKDDDVDYSFKYSDRKKLEQLKLKSNGADDILIVKNGFITDTSFANIVFFDGKQWFTPTDPLLKGTKRQYYLDQNIIFEKKIRIDDLSFYSKVRIINAMIDLDESKDIRIENIVF